MQKKVFIISLIVVVAGLLLYVWLNRRDGNETVVMLEVPTDSTQELWYKNSIIYTLDVEVFKDSNGDGTGDFNGLTSKLAYIDSLGVDAIWLAPFQPTPNKDDGYDISDFYTIDERLGTLEDFKNFMDQAKAHGFRVIMDLVANHTSNQHPWFQAARAQENSPYRAWYVWSEERPKNYDKGMVFPGVQSEIWSYDSVASAYFYHRFYIFQPDLNAQHPQVQSEMKKIMKHWLDLGLSGFRLDAVPFFIEKPDTKGEKFEAEYQMLTEMREYVDSLKNDAVILGEANVLPDENKNFFGEEGERMHMMFNFFVNQHLFYGLATGDASPLKDALNRTRKIPMTAQWGQFLRNHDEVDLGRLTKLEREKVYAKFGPDKTMQLYDRGIRRRLAPMLNNRREQIELAYSLLLSLPSTPVLRYGDEIGMGDDLSLQERLSVRTPMQWSQAPNAGFTTNKKPVRPVIGIGNFSFEKINVSLERKDSSSLLNWTRKMVRLRKQCPEIAYGTWDLVDTNSDHVLAILYRWNSDQVLVLHNFSEEESKVTLNVKEFSGLAEDLLSGTTVTMDDSDKYVLPVKGYEYRWIRIGPPVNN